MSRPQRTSPCSPAGWCSAPLRAVDRECAQASELEVGTVADADATFYDAEHGIDKCVAHRLRALAIELLHRPRALADPRVVALGEIADDVQRPQVDAELAHEWRFVT